MGVFELGQGLLKFEIADAHGISLTVGNWIYKGRLFRGFAVAAAWA